jgi:hypothetical protein
MMTASFAKLHQDIHNFSTIDDRNFNYFSHYCICRMQLLAINNPRRINNSLSESPDTSHPRTFLLLGAGSSLGATSAGCAGTSGSVEPATRSPAALCRGHGTENQIRRLDTVMVLSRSNTAMVRRIRYGDGAVRSDTTMVRRIRYGGGTGNQIR